MKNQIFVSDSLNNRIQVFNSDGKFLFSWGKFGDGEGEFHNPRAIKVNSKGQVLVADVSNERVQMFTEDGIFLTLFGGSLSNKFSSFGLALDNTDNIYVADSTQQGVQVFTAPQFFEYELYKSEKSWNDHDSEATTWGGHLVSLQSGDENDFVRAITNSNTCWIGATKSNEWTWSDGSDWIYSNIGKENGFNNLILAPNGKWAGSETSSENIALFKKSLSDNYCDPGHGILFVEIIMDGSPEEIRWEVTSELGSNIKESDTYKDPFVKYCQAICIPSEECFKFSIFDSFGDGLTFGGNGRYLVTWEGVVVGGGTDFDFRDDIYIRTCRPSDYCIDKKHLKIIVDTDHYGRDTFWNLWDENSFEVMGGPYGPEKRYIYEDCVPNICHKFQIFDSKEDGICCSYGDGKFTLEWEGESIKEGGNFGDSDLVYFPEWCNKNNMITPTNAPKNSAHICPIKGGIVDEVKFEAFKFLLDVIGEFIDLDIVAGMILYDLNVYSNVTCDAIDLYFDSVVVEANKNSRGQGKGIVTGRVKSPRSFIGGLIDPRTNKKKHSHVLKTGENFTFYPKDYIVLPCESLCHVSDLDQSEKCSCLRDICGGCDFCIDNILSKSSQTICDSKPSLIPSTVQSKNPSKFQSSKPTAIPSTDPSTITTRKPTQNSSHNPSVLPSSPCHSKCKKNKQCYQRSWINRCKVCDMCKTLCHKKCRVNKCLIGSWKQKCRGCIFC